MLIDSTKKGCNKYGTIQQTQVSFLLEPDNQKCMGASQHKRCSFYYMDTVKVFETPWVRLEANFSMSRISRNSMHADLNKRQNVSPHTSPHF